MPQRGVAGLLRRLPLAPTLTLSLIGLTLVLALIAALGIGNLYATRQDYEDSLARTYELESASSRLLAAAVIEETTFRRNDREAPAARRRARQAFDGQAAEVLALADDDAQSERLVRERIAAERRARRLAGQRRGPAVERRLTEAILSVREATDDLVARQRGRRARARNEAGDRTRTALITAVGAGGLALLGALTLIAALIGSIRRPLDELVTATQRLAAGDLSERVDPSGPLELRELDTAFNTMAERLEGAQARIEAEREKLSVTIESLGDALVVCDADCKVTTVNRRVAQIAPMLRPGVDARVAESPLPELEEALAGEVIVEHGDRTLAITAARLGRRAEDGVVWTLRDVSERARLERVKSDFVATASHELRSPLTSIKGFVELLGRSEALGPREREFVDVILLSTDRLVDLVNDLLDVARLEAGKMEVHPRLFDLAELVREMAALMAPRIAEKGQQLDLDLPSGLPRALADPSRVRQIVTNLLSNAHLYTNAGGRIAIRVDAREGWLRLSISDTGRGMSQDDVDRVFDRFVRRDDSAAGTGLGLSIVRSLVDLQGGRINVDSTPGEGTTFTVDLPGEPKDGQVGAPRFAITGKRVLVVDDEVEVGELIAAQLQPYDVQAEIVTSGTAALELLRSRHFDAVTLDLLMGETSGADVLREMRSDPELRGTPVVVVSIISAQEALFGEWKVGKPIDADELADALGSAVLAGRTRVLVVGRSALREKLEPALVRLGLDHEWVTSGTAAAQACQRRRFEIALVDAGMRSPTDVLSLLDLRGRRLDQAVVLFSSGDQGDGLARMGAETVPVEQAAAAVLRILSKDAEALHRAGERQYPVGGRAGEREPSGDEGERAR